MNKRIRKKKAKQQLIRAISGLVEAAEEMQREQERRTIQAGISYEQYFHECVRKNKTIRSNASSWYGKSANYKNDNG